MPREFTCTDGLCTWMHHGHLLASGRIWLIGAGVLFFVTALFLTAGICFSLGYDAAAKRRGKVYVP